jgi:ribonuclease J
MAKSKSKPPLRIVPLGGLGEIGMNCMIFEYEDELFLLDCGVLFSDLQMLGVDFFIPDFSYLKDRKDKVSAYVITHGHEDHIGALPWALRQYPAPVYCSPFARKLIESKLAEHGLEAEIIEFKPGKEITLRHFSITPQPVNHSIVEAFALFIKSPVGLLVHTGDFKIDPSPYYGKPLDPKPFVAASEEGVKLLLSDSTNVERAGPNPSEEIVYEKLNEIISNQSGLCIVTLFASNIARIGQILEICKKKNKRLALLGRSMDSNARIAYDLGYLDGLYDHLIDLDEIGLYPRDQTVVLSTGSQGEYRSGLMRVANNEHRSVKLHKGDTVVMSSRFIPGNEKPISRMINQLFRLGADVIYESSAQVHVSGHATAAELKTMIDYVKPEFFLPVHGEYRHLVKHKRLAEACGIASEKAIVAENGDVVEFDGKTIRVVEHFDENRIMIEGSTGEDLTKVVLKDRRKVAETGIVFAVIVRNSVNGEVVAGPDIMSRGFLDETQRQDLIDDAKVVMLDTIEELSKKNMGRTVNPSDIQEEVRIALRRFFNNKTGIKPVVVVIIVEI